MKTENEKPQMNTAILAAAIVLIVAVLVGLGRHYFVAPTPSLAQEMDLDRHPIPAWITQDAQQCQGDITKLDPAEQQKVRSAYKGQGARIIIMAAYSMAH